jgi:hypothetical protein
MASFRKRLEGRYQVQSEGEEGQQAPVTPTPAPAPKAGAEDTQPGSAHPDNWQTELQTGKSAEEIRQEAIALSEILVEWQSKILHAKEYFDVMTANQDKYLHMYNPILIKGLSREKLETIAVICQKFARIATIV